MENSRVSARVGALRLQDVKKIISNENVQQVLFRSIHVEIN